MKTLNLNRDRPVKENGEGTRDSGQSADGSQALDDFLEQLDSQQGPQPRGFINWDGVLEMLKVAGCNTGRAMEAAPENKGFLGIGEAKPMQFDGADGGEQEDEG